MGRRLRKGQKRMFSFNEQTTQVVETKGRDPIQKRGKKGGRDRLAETLWTPAASGRSAWDWRLAANFRVISFVISCQ